MKKTGVYIGIDPGSSTGGIACIRTFIGHPDEVFATGIKDMTERDLFNYLEDIVKNTSIGAEKFCIIENVWSFPEQGIVSSFKFGLNYGQLRMALIGLKIPFDAHSPQKWIKYYGMKKKIIGTTTDKKGEKKNILESKTDWKRRLRQKAEQLFPEVKMTNYIADALLIANYCKQLKN